jgi:hypothetical protein
MPTHQVSSGTGGIRSQVLVRQLNDQILSLGGIFGLETDFDLVCECANGGCFDRLRISPEEYEGVRRFPTRFIVKAGHANQQVERVVEDCDRYVVVEKIGPDAEAAILEDPRRGRVRDGRLG